MRTLLVVLAGLMLVAPARAQTSVEDMKKQTVLITDEGFAGNGRGSGVLLSSMTVLTCFHMADELQENEFFVYTYPLGTVVKAHVEMADKSADLMLLKLETPVEFSVEPVFQTSVTDGEPITVVGNALGAMKWYVTRGIISGSERDYLMTDAAVNHGNSGGPWFNANGEIVAISDWGMIRNGEEGITGGVSAKTITHTIAYWVSLKKRFDAIVKMLGGAQ